MGRIKQQTLGLVKSPPKFSAAIGPVIGSVSSRQQYDVLTGAFDPDYTKTPLTLDVSLSAIDNDMAYTATDIRKSLTNIHWYEVNPATGAEKEIIVSIAGSSSGASSIPAGYLLLDNKEGSATAGRLQVAKNAAPSTPLVLRFKADLNVAPDVFAIVKDIVITCRDVSPVVKCFLDMPQARVYNPVREGDTQTIRLMVLENGKTAAASHYIPVWEVCRTGGSWTAYGSDPTDYWLDIAADKCSAVIHYDLMGDGQSVRVRLRYSQAGNPSSVSLKAGDLSVPNCRFEVTRVVKYASEKIIGLTNTVTPGTKSIQPSITFTDSFGDIDNPDRFFMVSFYACPGDRALTASDLVGTARLNAAKTGLELPISVEANCKAGKSTNIGHSVDIIGPWKTWQDSDGSLLTDSDGSLLLIR